MTKIPKNSAQSESAGGARSTPEKILKATERLVIDLGAHAVSTRGIAAAAKSSISLITYHFGSFEGLLSELIHINADLFLACGASLFAALGEQPASASLEDLLMVLLRPLLLPAAFNSDERAAVVIHAIYRHVPTTTQNEMNDKLEESLRPLMQLFAAHLPYLNKDQIRWRLTAISTAAINMAPGEAAWEFANIIDKKQPTGGDLYFDEVLSMALATVSAPAGRPRGFKAGESGEAFTW